MAVTQFVVFVPTRTALLLGSNNLKWLTQPAVAISQRADVVHLDRFEAHVLTQPGGKLVGPKHEASDWLGGRAPREAVGNPCRARFWPWRALRPCRAGSTRSVPFGSGPNAEAVANVNDFVLSPREFTTRTGGLFLFVPDLVRLDADVLARDAKLPGSRMIPARKCIRSLTGPGHISG
jgi:hypothetical protein